MVLEIRELNENDYAAYMAFKYQLALETELTMDSYPEELETDVEIVKTKLAKQNDSGKRGYFAFAGAKIVGYSCFGPINKSIKCGHRCYLGIGILDGYRGQGLGTKLINLAIESMKTEGYKLCELEVFEGNEPARQLYLKSGFIAYGQRPMTAILKNGQTLSSTLMYKVL